MSAVLGLMLAGALAAVLVTLGLGVLNTARGGPPERSQKLMRLRVVLQGVAILVFLAFLFVRG
ncbi:MAG: twin transmembrane helix small protein [Hyphomicrobiales bacterium]|nr:twin transmembrane helix small protein [Hyphomicrobiales bacterium]